MIRKNALAAVTVAFLALPTMASAAGFVTPGSDSVVTAGRALLREPIIS